MNPNTLLLPHVWPRAERPTVNRCALLAVLLQVWLVLTFGNAPGGHARPGEGVWGAVNVTLRGPERPGLPTSAAPPPPALTPGPAGAAPLERWGGAVREQAPAPQAEPGAARLGDWAPQAALPVDVPADVLALPAPAAALPLKAAQAPALPLPPALPPLPALPALPPLPALAQPGEAARTVRQLGDSLRAAPPVAPTAAAQPLNTALPAPALATLPDLSAPAARPLMAPRPALPHPPAPVAALPAAPAPAAAPDLSGALPAPAAVPLMAPRAAPPRPAAPVAGLATSPASGAILPPTMPDLAQRLPVPAAVPQAPLATLSTRVPTAPAPSSDQTAPLSRPVQPLLPRPEAVPSPLPPTATLNAAPNAAPNAPPNASPAGALEPAGASAPTTASNAPLASSPLAPTPAPAAAAGGLPDAGSQLGHDVAIAPSQPASAPPRLNLQLARQRGGELSRGMGGGLLAVMPRPPEVDDKLGQQIRKAGKTDCRQAYAAAGLLAVVPLAVDAFKGEGNCKW